MLSQAWRSVFQTVPYARTPGAALAHLKAQNHKFSAAYRSSTAKQILRSALDRCRFYKRSQGRASHKATFTPFCNKLNATGYGRNRLRLRPAELASASAPRLKAGCIGPDRPDPSGCRFHLATTCARTPVHHDSKTKTCSMRISEFYSCQMPL